MSQMRSGTTPPPRYVIAAAPRRTPGSVPFVEEAPSTPQEPLPEKLAYSLTSAAKALDVSLSTIRRAIDAGEIRSTKLGRRRVIPAQALEEFLAPKSN
ncbi:helix-turn-helix domain-containing protein [Rhodopirellula sp. SWK7]|uniref:helix-turn-helix domain-containing protein n=1 Tax=Rhodopirellula sp. SWK7 TaxID=595460 RepID=UPI0005C655EA